MDSLSNYGRSLRKPGLNMSGLLGVYIDGLVQDCSNSSALAMELLQSCTKPSIWNLFVLHETVVQSHSYYAC